MKQIRITVAIIFVVVAGVVLALRVNTSDNESGTIGRPITSVPSNEVEDLSLRLNSYSSTNHRARFTLSTVINHCGAVKVPLDVVKETSGDEITLRVRGDGFNIDKLRLPTEDEVCVSALSEARFEFDLPGLDATTKTIVIEYKGSKSTVKITDTPTSLEITNIGGDFVDVHGPSSQNVKSSETHITILKIPNTLGTISPDLCNTTTEEYPDIHDELERFASEHQLRRPSEEILSVYPEESACLIYVLASEPITTSRNLGTMDFIDYGKVARDVHARSIILRPVDLRLLAQ